MRRLADPVLTQPRQRHAQGAHAGRAGGRHRSALGDASRGARSAARGHRAVDRAGAGRHARRAAPRAEYADLARRAIARAVDPASPDFLNFTRDRQPLVDAAFLAQGLLRAPRALRDALDRDDETAARRRARIDASDRAGLQQLAAVLGDGRSGAEEPRRRLGSPARRLRAPPARAVVQGRRRVRRRPRVPLGLLQQLRDPPDADRRARRVQGRVAGVEGARARAWQRARRRYAAVQERLDRARRQLPGHRPIDRLSLRRVPPAGAGRAATHAARRRVARRRSAAR